MEKTVSKQKSGHIVWLDIVRLAAMFMVVCCHCTDPFNFYPGTSPEIGEIKFWGAAYGALLRPCVPLFVMITGALLLPVRESSGAFYKKRITRVFFPFLIWSVLYNLFPWVTGLLGVEPRVILDFFPYSGEDVMRQSLEDAESGRLCAMADGAVARRANPEALCRSVAYLRELEGRNTRAAARLLGKEVRHD